jgi:hypothetical protein
VVGTTCCKAARLASQPAGLSRLTVRSGRFVARSKAACRFTQKSGFVPSDWANSQAVSALASHGCRQPVASWRLEVLNSAVAWSVSNVPTGTGLIVSGGPTAHDHDQTPGWSYRRNIRVAAPMPEAAG